jgi:hypothetical protein
MRVLPCRRLGGKVFTADSTKPPLRWPKVFAVCPASLPRETEAALMAADASFRLVHPNCRVTTYWMDKCIKVGMGTVQFILLGLCILLSLLLWAHIGGDFSPWTGLKQGEMQPHQAHPWKG